ncbi:4045_t:CDS:2 [Acaulospora morrowiae]|uniref:4045_t:CDS:1 n=1 Tax=Acaulospora morrowiae TaxID=94023 RepID=A0A9N9EA67_9GLOM|nr:4045_t:CDS:2 [Acaulospora morrowiae]
MEKLKFRIETGLFLLKILLLRKIIFFPYHENPNCICYVLCIILSPPPKRTANPSPSAYENLNAYPFMDYSVGEDFS